METEYLSIKDFAKRAGVSQQAIYKQVERKLNNYVKMVENQKMIDIRALQEVYGVEVEQPIQPKIEPVEQPIQPILQATIESLSKELERKSEELQAKDKQYADLKATNDKLINQMEEKDKQHHDEIVNLQKLLDQEQQLNAMNQQKILALETKLEEPNETDPKESDETQKGFWSRLFKK